MSDDDSFKFQTDQGGMAQFPPVLIAILAIIAIVLVNSTALAPVVSASTPAPKSSAATFKSMPALLEDSKLRIEHGAAPGGGANPPAAGAAIGTLI